MSDHTTQAPLKQCSKCGERYPATTEYFNKGKHYKDGLFGQCRSCRIAAHAAYNASHRDKIKAYNAAYRAAWRNSAPEVERNRRAAYNAAHPLKSKVKKHRYHARKRQLPATFTEQDWARSLEYFGYCCAVCGRPRGFWHTLSQDHWIPLTRGGGYTPDNIVPLCHGDGGCNNRKGNRDAHEWLIEQFGQRKARLIERRIHDYFEHMNHPG